MQVYTIDVFSRATGDRWDVSCTFDVFADAVDAVKAALGTADAAAAAAFAVVPPRKRFFNDTTEVVAFRKHNMSAFLHAAVRHNKVPSCKRFEGE
jgi:hypothetical protein